MIKEVVFSTSAEPDDVIVCRLLEYLQKKKEVNGVFYDLKIKNYYGKDKFVLEYRTNSLKWTKIAKLVLIDGKLVPETQFYEEIIKSVLTNKPSRTIKELFPGFKNYVINGVKLGSVITGEILNIGKKNLILKNKYDNKNSNYWEFLYNRNNIRIMVRVYGKNKYYIKVRIFSDNYTLKDIAITEGGLEKLLNFIDEGNETDVLKYVMPGIPIKFVTDTYSLNDLGNVFYIGYRTEDKQGTIRAKVDDAGIKYEGVPFEEGVFDITVPYGFDGDILSPRSIEELSDNVKIWKKTTGAFLSAKGYMYLYYAPNVWTVKTAKYTVESNASVTKIYLGSKVYEIDHEAANAILVSNMDVDEIETFLRFI